MLYRRDPVGSEILAASIAEPQFRFSDVVGGLVAGKCALEDGLLRSGSRRGIISDNVMLAVYYLVATKAVIVRKFYYQQTFLDSFQRDSNKILIEKDPDFEGFGELESPFLGSVYAAVGNGRPLSTIVKTVLDGYMGPGKHDRPVTTFFTAMLQGEMRYWRLERETSGWGFVSSYRFSCPADHVEILDDAHRSALRGVVQMQQESPALGELLNNLSCFFIRALDSRKRVKQHHHPHKRHRKHKRRRRSHKPGDPGIWLEGDA